MVGGELGLSNVVNVARENRNECRCESLVLALVQGIGGDERGDSSFFQMPNNDFFIERLLFDVVAGLQDFEKLFSKLSQISSRK